MEAMWLKKVFSRKRVSRLAAIHEHGKESKTSFILPRLLSQITAIHLSLNAAHFAITLAFSKSKWQQSVTCQSWDKGFHIFFLRTISKILYDEFFRRCTQIVHLTRRCLSKLSTWSKQCNSSAFHKRKKVYSHSWTLTLMLDHPPIVGQSVLQLFLGLGGHHC